MAEENPKEYRGIPVPGRLRQFYYNTSGRYWRMGIDTILDSEAYDDLVEKAFRYEQLNK
jgi:hypothetical protein